MEEERARPAGGVEYASCERLCKLLVDHGFSEPIGRVIFAEFAPGVGSDDRLVQHLKDVFPHHAPVKSHETPGERRDELLAAFNLKDPIEEVGFNDAIN